MISWIKITELSVRRVRINLKKRLWRLSTKLNSALGKMKNVSKELDVKEAVSQFFTQLNIGNDIKLLRLLFICSCALKEPKKNILKQDAAQTMQWIEAVRERKGKHQQNDNHTQKECL